VEFRSCVVKTAKKVVGVTLAATAAGVVAGYVYDWWKARQFELFDPMWIERAASCSCLVGPSVLVDFDPADADVWCRVHGDPELGCIVVRD
jgi:hypothetical protein